MSDVKGADLAKTIADPRTKMRRSHAWMALACAFVAGMGTTATVILALQEGYPRPELCALTLAMVGFAVFSTATSLEQA